MSTPDQRPGGRAKLEIFAPVVVLLGGGVLAAFAEPRAIGVAVMVFALAVIVITGIVDILRAVTMLAEDVAEVRAAQAGAPDGDAAGPGRFEVYPVSPTTWSWRLVDHDGREVATGWNANADYPTPEFPSLAAARMSTLFIAGIARGAPIEDADTAPDPAGSES